jgi:tight adherence protein C
MSQLTIALVALFGSLALLAGMATSAVLARQAPGRRRLLGLDGAGPKTSVLVDQQLLTDRPTPAQKKLAALVPKSPKEMGRLQRRLVTAGYYGFKPALIYSLAQLIGAASGFVVVFFVFGLRTGFLYAVAGAVVGYLLPSYYVARRTRLRKKQIQNGLPDALDLLIVSLEAGLAMDQAILKCSEELIIAYPALSHELQLVNTETRAGKPRVEALKNFARRTQVDDARALVAMLVQTERFGTSVAQALRTHAEESRVKRRQRAEEKAAKLSVKLIFPLVFCLLPAFFVVAVGPGIIKFVEVFSNVQMPGGGVNP